MAEVPCIGMKPILIIDGAYTQKITQDGSDRDQYIGIAKPGSATSAATWQIRKISYSATNHVADIQWADGNDLFDNVMDNAASLTYS